MKLPHPIRFFLFFTAAIWGSETLEADNFSHPNHLSPKKAEEFLAKVREKFCDTFTFCVKFRLYESANKKHEKFGTVAISSSRGNNVLGVSFGDGACRIHAQKNPILENIGEGKFSLHDPFFEKLVLSPLDLLFIFPGGTSCSYRGPARISGRPVQQFIFPVGESENFSSAKVSMDEKFMVILRVDFLNDHGKPIRRMEVNSFKNFNDFWFPRIIELSDWQNRQYAKLEILSVAENEQGN